MAMTGQGYPALFFIFQSFVCLQLRTDAGYTDAHFSISATFSKNSLCKFFVTIFNLYLRIRHRPNTMPAMLVL